jgi:hypothetical protein
LSGTQERQLHVGLREAFADPLLGADAVAESEVESLAAGSPNAARAVLALYRAWRVAREDANGIALPSGRRLLLPNEEVRDFFDDHANHFPILEEAAETLANELAPGVPAEMNHAIAERLRAVHGVRVTVQPLEMALRRYDPATRSLALSESLPRESRGFHMAFQLALLEAREAVETVLKEASPSTTEAGMLLRIGLLNYVAGALVMPYAAFHAAASELRHDMEAIAARFGVSFEQACHRLSTLQRIGARGAVLLFAGRSGGQRVQAILGGRISVRAVWRVVPALGCTYGVRPAEYRAGTDRRAAGWRRLPVFRSGRGAAGGAVGRAAADSCRGDGMRFGQCRGRGLRGRAGSGPSACRHWVIVPTVRPARLR